MELKITQERVLMAAEQGNLAVKQTLQTLFPECFRPETLLLDMEVVVSRLNNLHNPDLTINYIDQTIRESSPIIRNSENP